MCINKDSGLFTEGKGEGVEMDVTIKTALISVSDKAGVVDFAKALSQLGVKIVSTGVSAANGLTRLTSVRLRALK